MCVVVPPHAMPRVSSSGPRVRPGSSGWVRMAWARCVWGSTPPGATIRPDGVEDPGPVRRQRPGEREHGDALALDPDVPGAHALGVIDRAAADHEVERHAASVARASAGVNAARGRGRMGGR